MHTSDATTLLCEYWDSVGIGDVTDRDMKFAAKQLVYPISNISLVRIDTHSNHAGGACAMKLENLMMKVLEKCEVGCRHQIIYWNTFNRSYRGYLKVWQPK